MGRAVWGCFFAFIGVCLLYIVVVGIGIHVTPGGTASERLENAQWVASGSWWDRQTCRWVEVCGAWHMVHKGGWTWKGYNDKRPSESRDLTSFWHSSNEDPSTWSKKERQLREIPAYVLDYAPYVHLFSGEQYWPSDIAEHLVHSTPKVNYTIVASMKDACNLTNLDELDRIDGAMHGRYMYLHSDDNVEAMPQWLTSTHNIPTRRLGLKEAKTDGEWSYEDGTVASDERRPSKDSDRSKRAKASMDGTCGGGNSSCDPLHGTCDDPLRPLNGPHFDLRKRTGKQFSSRPRVNQNRTTDGRSNAPAVLVVIDKGFGVVDAFWFFFYSFNLGQEVFGIRFGNHVGDWEHTMIRFRNGTPEAVYFSEHDFGDAYTWDAVEKYLLDPNGTGFPRPVIFSATGSHAMYARPGLHPYILPFGLLHDQTDRGPLWDPKLNFKSFTYDDKAQILRASKLNPQAPTGWFDYAGHWGDKYYPLGDPRQYRLAGQYHYVNGPTGPKFKALGRETVCERAGRECVVKDYIGGRMPPKKLTSIIEGGEEGGLPGGNRTD
ncbi:hypothetical protein BAUCODRAFT_109511 [Baudoinia panamericana UAMH 10762]|uniref:Vacuolar protein sorting-associated protein 62 n=1 Tax=Baudoinia panamericana (strain UAMH 10762) TaxID=717646 RepID=M2MGU9_BAUPA|nr:uncharacterized protein BAUCODRAFT_109511 [Baudoinia panamericana UAMH 10762]EMC95861.1 hypothetical protein BAUCODRAFT_109511 [Baudoinia panamericana UAMH 10762]